MLRSQVDPSWLIVAGSKTSRRRLWLVECVMVFVFSEEENQKLHTIIEAGFSRLQAVQALERSGWDLVAAFGTLLPGGQGGLPAAQGRDQ